MGSVFWLYNINQVNPCFNVYIQVVVLIVMSDTIESKKWCITNAIADTSSSTTLNGQTTPTPVLCFSCCCCALLLSLLYVMMNEGWKCALTKSATCQIRPTRSNILRLAYHIVDPFKPQRCIHSNISPNTSWCINSMYSKVRPVQVKSSIYNPDVGAGFRTLWWTAEEGA